jgi:Fe-Mn family superoxide dismutase
MAFRLPDLPYAQNALEPYISANTLSYHYGKHHQAYVTNLNTLTEGTEFAQQSLEEVIKATATDTTKTGIFNNAAQVWNHTFYWHCMRAHGGGLPTEPLMTRLIRDFGSFDHFTAEFKQAAISQFGSGWAWLVEKDGRLSIMKTGNADLPMVHEAKALLTCDVWEHAYYLDYQNRRPDYVETFINHLVNWDFVTQNLEG